MKNQSQKQFIWSYLHENRLESQAITLPLIKLNKMIKTTTATSFQTEKTAPFITYSRI